MFGARCAKCGIAFSENDLVMRARQLVYRDDLDQNMDKYDAQKDRVMRARQHVYHDDQKYLDQNLDQNDDQKDLVMRARQNLYQADQIFDQNDLVMRARQNIYMYHHDQNLDHKLDQTHLDQKDLVMRARQRIYHVECFQCSVCGRRLVPGDEFCERGGADDAALVCRCDDIFRR